MIKMFALINRNLTDTGRRKQNVVMETLNDDGSTTPFTVDDLHPAKPYWVPVVEEITDISTGLETVVSPWIETVEVARLLRTQTIRDKTQVELAAEDTTSVAALMANSGVDRALAKALFQVVNDVRVLKGQATITPTQFKSYLKGLIR